jgi:hypothetical protein
MLSFIIFEVSPIIIDDESLIMLEVVSPIGAVMLLSVVEEVSLPLPQAVKTTAKTMIDKNFFIVIFFIYFFLTAQM